MTQKSSNFSLTSSSNQATKEDVKTAAKQIIFGPST
jgi:hypothetical protein